MGTLYRYELKKALKLLCIFIAIITMYVVLIIQMYEHKTMKLLDDYVKVMPKVMHAVGMSAGNTSLLGFMNSYLYGFILLVFPMIYIVIKGLGLLARYLDEGTLVSLLSGGHQRTCVLLTQYAVLLTTIVLLDVYITILEIACAHYYFPGALKIKPLLALNIGLYLMHFVVAAFVLFISSLALDYKVTLLLSAGMPALMYIMQMLKNTVTKIKVLKYTTIFTLYDTNGLIKLTSTAFLKAGVLAILCLAMMIGSLIIFKKRDLSL